MVDSDFEEMLLEMADNFIESVSVACAGSLG